MARGVGVFVPRVKAGALLTFPLRLCTCECDKVVPVGSLGGFLMLGNTCRCQVQLFWTWIHILPFSPCQNCLVKARTVNSETDTEHVSG